MSFVKAEALDAKESDQRSKTSGEIAREDYEFSWLVSVEFKRKSSFSGKKNTISFIVTLTWLFFF